MSEKKDVELDPCSSEFDPLLALYSENVRVPDPGAPIFDNISRFEASTSTAGGIDVKPIRLKKEKPQEPKEQNVVTKDSEGNRNLEGWDNVITRMNRVKGPLSVLRDCAKKKARVKIVTRNENGIRGYVTGYVVAFDKMWNLALEDATEVWTRRRKKKIPALDGAAATNVPTDRSCRIKQPEILIEKIDKKTEKCERNLEKIILRGEHIVLINVLDS